MKERNFSPKILSVLSEKHVAFAEKIQTLGEENSESERDEKIGTARGGKSGE
jgi:hypothetical protein